MTDAQTEQTTKENGTASDYEAGYLAAIAKAYAMCDDFYAEDARRCLDELADGRHYTYQDAKDATTDRVTLLRLADVFASD